MKVLVWFFTVLVGCRAAARPAFSPMAKTKSSVLSIPRGGGVFGTDLTKKNLAAAFVAMKVVNGLATSAAPEVGADKIFRVKGVQEGSVEQMWWEYFGSTALGNALMIYLSVFKGYSAEKSVMWGGVGCTFVTLRHVLKGTFAKNGFMEGFGMAQLLTMAGLLSMVAFEKGDPTLVSKIFVAIPALTSTLSMINTDALAGLYGLSSPPTGGHQTAFACMHKTALWVYGIISICLLLDIEPLKAVGYGALAKALAIADIFFVRKVMTSDTDSLGYASVTAIGLIGLGLVLDEPAAAVPKA